MRLLIVDDSALIRFHIRGFLGELSNVEIAEAVSGIEALEKHRTFKPDIIILDYIMPAPDGLAILKIVTKIDKNVKLIMATTLGNQKYIYKSFIECGAFAILAKPIIKEDLLHAVKSIEHCINVGDAI